MKRIKKKPDELLGIFLKGEVWESHQWESKKNIDELQGLPAKRSDACFAPQVKGK